MKLISMSDYVLDYASVLTVVDNFKDLSKVTNSIFNYANFLKQPLKLGMFVPCDEDGNVLEYPIDIYYRPDFDCQKFPQECYQHDLEAFEKAKEKVLFEGFEVQKQGGEFLVKYKEKPVWVNWNDSKKIEDLIYLQVECAVTF